MSQSSHINEIFKSRKHIVNFLKRQGFNVADYDSFSIHEVNAMYQVKQMDMLFKKDDGSKKTYVKYHSCVLFYILRVIHVCIYILDTTVGFQYESCVTLFLWIILCGNRHFVIIMLMYVWLHMCLRVITHESQYYWEDACLRVVMIESWCVYMKSLCMGTLMY